jgi:hypothetical protein
MRYLLKKSRFMDQLLLPFIIDVPRMAILEPEQYFFIIFLRKISLVEITLLTLALLVVVLEIIIYHNVS